MKTTLKPAIFCIAITLFSTASLAQTLATVGNKEITVAEFNKKFAEVVEQSYNPPTKDLFLEDLIRYEMGLQEAQKRGLQNDPMVRDRIQQEIYKGLLEKELGDKVEKIEVTENEMKRWYQSNPEIRTSHILIEVPRNATAAQRREAQGRAQDIYKKVRASKEPFEQLVTLYTDDPLSKQNGGDVGWQTRTTLFPSYYEASIKMKLNEVRGLVESPFGFHIIKLTGRKSYENANKQQIRMAVFDEKRRDIFNRYFAELKKNYKIQVNKKLIQ